jgi:hypothetical protein
MKVIEVLTCKYTLKNRQKNQSKINMLNLKLHHTSWIQNIIYILIRRWRHYKNVVAKVVNNVRLVQIY